MNVSVLDQQVAVGRSHIDMTLPNRSTVLGMDSFQGSGAIQNLRQVAFSKRIYVEYNEKGSWKTARQSRAQLLQCFNATGRRSDHDDVARCHALRLAPAEF